MTGRGNITAVTLAVVMSSPAALADPIEDFYSGQQITFIVRSPPGTTYDQYTRLLARHMMRHVPGTPQSSIVLMPGAGVRVFANVKY